MEDESAAAGCSEELPGVVLSLLCFIGTLFTTGVGVDSLSLRSPVCIHTFKLCYEPGHAGIAKLTIIRKICNFTGNRDHISKK